MQQKNDGTKQSQHLKRLNISIYYISFIAVFRALIYVFTAFAAFRIGTGYVHLGDIFIFTACVFLNYYAVIPAILGSVIADLSLGYSHYAVATAIIKGLMSMIFLAVRGKKGFGVRLLIAMIISSLFMQISYTGYELLLVALGSNNALTYALVLSPILILSNFTQTIFGVLGGWLLIKTSQKLNLFDRTKSIMSIEKEKHE